MRVLTLYYLNVEMLHIELRTIAIKVGKMRKLPHHVMFQIGRQKPKPSEWAFSVL